MEFLRNFADRMESDNRDMKWEMQQNNKKMEENKKMENINNKMDQMTEENKRNNLELKRVC